jgi:hypothetical protein
VLPSTIARVVRTNQWRLRVAKAFDAILGSLLWVASIVISVAALVSAELLPRWMGVASFWIAALVALGFVMYETIAGTSTASVAQTIDQSFKTSDRLATSLDFSERAGRTPLMQAALEEAEVYTNKNLQQARVPMPAPKHLRKIIFVGLAVAIAAPTHLLSFATPEYTPAPRLVALAKKAEVAHQELGALEALAEKKALPKLASQLRDARAELRKNQRALEEKLEKPLWDLPPEDRKEVMPHEDQELPPEDLNQPDADPNAALPPPMPVGGAMVALAAAQGLLDQTPIGKFDADPPEQYKEAFDEIDKMFKFSPTMSAKDLTELATKVDRTAKMFNNMGADSASESPGGGGGALDPKQNFAARTNGKPPAKKDPGIADDLTGLMQKSFGEFLKKYTEHIKEEAVKRATHEAQKDAQATMNIKLPPDKKTKLNERKPAEPTGKPDSLQQMDQNMAKELMEKLMNGKGKEQISEKENGAQVGGDKTQAGGKGSGKGAGDQKAQEDAKGKGEENVDLTGQVGDGKSNIQVIRDYSKFGATGPAESTAMYELYQGAIKEASQGLSQPGIPDEMREYVKLYFLALDPKTNKKK